ncbi:alpha/beta hydrolase [Kordiimonas aquimaris]|uniref:alpha/beta hydrolase n=1 Tax=Kordiimonas aquimaris TaxID=707591 RepID=UPI0021CFE5CC|nr:lysophospholipase [Kordiimonas aquimaris]
MKNRFVLRFTAWVFLSFCAVGLKAQDIGEVVNFDSSDGTIITGYWQQVNAGHETPTIILFHMGGASARGEYAEIAPILNAEGFNTLAVDLRGGGDRLGAPNQTMQRLGNVDIPYCDTYPDLEASLDWVKNKNLGAVIVWGSSYSATLGIQLIAKNGDDVVAALAFSPASGGPMAACRPDAFLDQLTVPLLTFRPSIEMEYGSVIEQAKLFRAKRLPYIEVKDGVHGSRMLLKSSTGVEMDTAWGRVFAFLQAIQ